MTFEQISKRSGASRTTIYRRWRSREEIVAQALGKLREQAEAGFSDWAERPLSELVDWLIQQVPHQLLNPVYRSLARNVMALDDASELKAIYSQTILEPRRKAFSAMIHAARERGELPAGADPELMQDMLSGALLYQVVMAPPDRSEQDLRTYVAQLLKGLGLMPDRD